MLLSGDQMEFSGSKNVSLQKELLNLNALHGKNDLVPKATLVIRANLEAPA